MAITIRQAPQTITPGFNEITYVVSSNNTSQANFQYVVDIYLSNQDGSITFAGQSYLRRKTTPDPIHTSGVFNVGRDVENYLTYDIFNHQIPPLYTRNCSGSIIQCICKFGEEYGPSSAIVVYPNLTTATTIRAWNAGMDWLEFQNYNKNSFVGSTASTTRKFLTNRASSGTTRQNQKEYLYLLRESTNEAININVRIYNSVGAILDTQQISMGDGGGLPNLGSYMQQIFVGTDYLYQFFSAANWANTVKYEIFTTNDSGQQDRESQWYIIDTSCSQHDIYRLYFLNEYGGFDAFNFTLAHSDTVDITARDKFKRNTITRLGGGSYGYNKSDFSEMTYYTRLKDKTTVHSDWINEATSTWLEELITSPVIFLDHTTHGKVAVRITDTSYTKRQHVTDKIFNLTVTFEYSFDRFRQRF